MRPIQFYFLGGVLFCLVNAPGSLMADKIIGKPAPEWKLKHWINSEPLSLGDLKGKVVLVRWWTAPDCPYCKATAPALNEFYEDFHDKGLEVIGIYHHKSEEPLRKEDVAKYARDFRFKFPVAIDPDWVTLKKWWLSKGNQDFTSVTFLIDKEGIVQFV